MRKRAIIVAVVVMTSLLPALAQAGTIKSGTLRFEATPCALACSYNLSFVNPTVPQKFDACEAPSPQGAFDDVVLKAPTRARSLMVSVTPKVEWDMFICSKPARGNNGKLLAKNLNNIWVCQIACTEVVTLRVVAGRSYVVRAYNVWDPNDLIGRYWFKS